MPMQDYTTFQMAEVVSHFPFFDYFALASSFIMISLLPHQVIAGVRNLMWQHA